MNNVARQALMLTLVGGLSLAVAVAWWQLTEEPIEHAQRELQSRQWLAVLPPDSYDNDPLQAPLHLDNTQLAHSQLLAGFRATLSAKPVAVVLRSRIHGYAGPIELAIAIAANGRLLGIEVLHQQESPGLGDRLVDPALRWLDQFTGRTRADAWAIKRDQGDFDQLAGATVTSRAVIDALQDTLRYFDEHRASLIEGNPDE